jgi:ubiquinone/menaquinone biosynthesis C-methylase UbiE
MPTPNFLKSYQQHVRRLARWMPKKMAMSRAVGGSFEAVGSLEFYLLLQLGLKPDHSVIDVGCGSGRLAVKLRDFLAGPYLGTDVVNDLVSYASTQCNRHDWKFEVTSGVTIPAKDASADFVCFFSVFTHLLHEETYRYLSEARRVLKPSGKIVFSFLEFAVEAHWNVFEATMKDSRADKVLNQFMSRDAIEAWARHLNLRVEHLFRGDSEYIELQKPVRFDDGRIAEGSSSLGQSACVLTLRT